MNQTFDFPFTDMHCHVLPAVDDGSKDLDMSMNMLRTAYENNIRTIIVTPHNKVYQKSVSPQGIYTRIAQLQKEISKAHLEIQLYPGNELYFDSTLVERLENQSVLSMASTEYVLVEFNPMDEYSYISESLRKLSYEGWHPILAHCERYECLYRKRDRVSSLCQEGILLQVNASSVMEGLFSRTGRFVRRLLAEHKVSFIGTDAHRDHGERQPFMTECAAYIIKRYGEDYARKVLYENATELIRERARENSDTP